MLLYGLDILLFLQVIKITIIKLPPPDISRNTYNYSLFNFIYLIYNSSCF